MSRIDSAIALTRFSLGAARGEIAAGADDPRGRLIAQLRPGGHVPLSASLPGVQEMGPILAQYIEERRRARQAAAAGMPVEDDAADAVSGVVNLLGYYREEVSARTRHAAETPSGFHERLVRFWSNHFTVALTSPQVIGLAGPFEREAIRPHVTGRFVDMLLAAESHPAMLIYLDNVYSIGPSTRIARRRGRGLNENLAREILELHTLGVTGGYDQNDVEEFARALTGWTVGNRFFGSDRPGQFHFEQRIHEPGARVIMGRRYAESGQGQAEAVLRDLAASPATARHLATKLARHFIADEPPADAVAALERRFLDTEGDLAEVSAALVSLQAAWAPEQPKMKTSEEFFLSSLRILEPGDIAPRDLAGIYRALGQRPFAAPSPAGWPDEAEAWAGPDQMMKRLEWADAAAARFPTLNPAMVLEEGLGPLASDRTRQAVDRAASGRQGLTLALMSPEFQRR